MYDAVFFLNNALKVNQLSVYNTDERVKQTIGTVESIQKYCPNSAIFMFDSSPEDPGDLFQPLTEMGVNTFYYGQDEHVKMYSELGQRSVAECITFIAFINWYKTLNVQTKRIYKLSGRYRLNDNFVLDANAYEGAFVFTKSEDTWMDKAKQDLTGVSKLYKLRLWHMDSSLLDDFHMLIPAILYDCAKFHIDVEHSYYKNIHGKFKTVEVDKIGVEGNIAPSGEFVNE
jgi:hypothetical protein